MVNFNDPTTKLSTLMQIFEFDLNRMNENIQSDNAIDMLRKKVFDSGTSQPERKQEEKQMGLEDRLKMIEYLLQSLLQSQGGING